MTQTVLRDFPTETRRFTAGQEVSEADIPAPQRAALVEAGYLSKPATAAPLPRVTSAEPIAD